MEEEKHYLLSRGVDLEPGMYLDDCASSRG